MNEIIKTIFCQTIKSYEQILECYYPSHGSNGFTERNLTFNFSHNYLLHNSKAIVWQEVPIGSREHFDTLIIDNKEKSIIIIEAKRLGTNAKHESIMKDFSRIETEYHRAKKVEKLIEEGYKLYAMLLVDIWIPMQNGDKKKVQRENFEKKDGVFSKPIYVVGSNEDYYIGFKLVEISNVKD